jgi:hypothetical protein
MHSDMTGVATPLRIIQVKENSLKSRRYHEGISGLLVIPMAFVPSI